MDHAGLCQLRASYNQENILLCFNGPFTQGLIEELGNALRNYMGSESAGSSTALDVFAVYIEIAQNIRQYSSRQGYGENLSSATVVIGRDPEGRYLIMAGNVVEAADGELLVQRVNALSAMGKDELKAAYKAQLRQPRESGGAGGAGLGLIDIARKAREAVSGSITPLEGGTHYFFSLRVVI